MDLAFRGRPSSIVTSWREAHERIFNVTRHARASPQGKVAFATATVFFPFFFLPESPSGGPRACIMANERRKEGDLSLRAGMRGRPNHHRRREETGPQKSGSLSAPRA